jgi:hypothetical protein
MRTGKSDFRKVIPIAQFLGGPVEHSAWEELRRFDLGVEFHVCGSASSRRGGS